MSENIIDINEINLDTNQVSSNSSDNYYIYNLSGSNVCSVWPHLYNNTILRNEQLNLLNGESSLLKEYSNTISSVNTDSVVKSIYRLQYIDAIYPLTLKTTLCSYSFFQVTTDSLNISLFDPVFFSDKNYISFLTLTTLTSTSPVTGKSALDILSKPTNDRILINHQELPCSTWAFKKLNQISFNLIEDLKNIKHKVSYNLFKNTDSSSFMSPYMFNNQTYTERSFSNFATSTESLISSKGLIRRIQDVSDKQMLNLSSVVVSPSAISQIYQTISNISAINTADINVVLNNYISSANLHNFNAQNLQTQKFVGNNIKDYSYQIELQNIKEDIINLNKENTRFLLSLPYYYTSPFPLLPVFFDTKHKELKSEYFDIAYPPIEIDYSNNKPNYINEYIKYRLI